MSVCRDPRGAGLGAKRTGLNEQKHQKASRNICATPQRLSLHEMNPFETGGEIALCAYTGSQDKSKSFIKIHKGKAVESKIYVRRFVVLLIAQK
jgi:hypothetical protein